jgi:hypothetical protein
MSDKIPLQISAYMNKFSSLATGGIKFEFTTQENVNPELLTEFFKNKDKLGHLLFAVRQIDLIDLSSLPKIDQSKYENGKSPGQRLRNVLFLIHQAQGGNKDNFNDFYNEKMEKIITHYKNILNEL